MSSRWWLGVVWVALVGCGTAGTTAAPTVRPAGQPAVLEGTVLAAFSDPASPVPAGDLRVGVESVLARHVVLGAEALRASVDGDPGLQAIIDALGANTAELVGLATAVHGDVAGSAWDSLWTGHVRSLMAYGTAVATGDDTGRSTARAELSAFQRDFADFGAMLTLHAVSPRQLEDLLAAQVDALLRQAEEWDAGEHDAAVRTTRTAYGQMAVTAQVLTEAMAARNPDRFPGSPTTPAVRARSAATLAVTEYVTLRAQAARAGTEGARDALTAAAEEVGTDLQRLGVDPRAVVDADVGALLARQGDAWTRGRYDVALAAADDALAEALGLLARAGSA